MTMASKWCHKGPVLHTPPGICRTGSLPGHAPDVPARLNDDAGDLPEVPGGHAQRAQHLRRRCHVRHRDALLHDAHDGPLRQHLCLRPNDARLRVERRHQAVPGDAQRRQQGVLILSGGRRCHQVDRHGRLANHGFPRSLAVFRGTRSAPERGPRSSTMSFTLPRFPRQFFQNSCFSLLTHSSHSSSN